ncbi:MAG: plasmid pRiA4b ORF-3 family protein [Actinomycetia bacterium]|nr:plasmid pRiA4b ORF-3 family protein [Actinomycetes bacterium]MCP5024770.1 plasmid pRiA4b ORF-3 family protein [Actinomycetes bacterium]
MGATLDRVKIEVEEIRPVIWRRFDVDSEASLDDVHMAIQIGLGWENFHLHRFQVGYDRYSSSPNGGGDSSDSRSVTLGSVTKAGGRLGYVYDYGDNWALMLTVEKVVAKRGDRPFVRCTHGRRAGPPEDIGGPWGYHELVVAMKTGRGSRYSHWRQINGGVSRSRSV